MRVMFTEYLDYLFMRKFIMSFIPIFQIQEILQLHLK